MKALARAAAGLVVAVSVGGAAAARQAPAPDDWRPFEANWSATGERHTLPGEAGRTGVIVHLSGALVVRTGDGLARGFRAEAIGFDDGRAAGAGRAVWTDDHGDQVFSLLTGNAGQAGRRIVGTITGGTGRYAGLAGAYTFTWEYVLPGEEERIHATAVTLSGKYRREAGR